MLVKDIIYQIIPLLENEYDMYHFMAQSKNMWDLTLEWRKINWSLNGLMLQPYESRMINYFRRLKPMHITISNTDANMRLKYICANLYNNSVIVINNKVMGEWKKFLTSLNRENLTVYDAKVPEKSRVIINAVSVDKIMLVNMTQYQKLKIVSADCLVDDWRIPSYDMVNYSFMNDSPTYVIKKISDGIRAIINERTIITDDFNGEIKKLCAKTPQYILTTMLLNIDCESATKDGVIDATTSIADTHYYSRNTIAHKDIIFVGNNNEYNEFKMHLNTMLYTNYKSINITFFNVSKVDNYINRFNSVVPFSRKNAKYTRNLVKVLTILGIPMGGLSDNDLQLLFKSYNDMDEYVIEHLTDENSMLEHKNILDAML
jgi:hypothetical protein